jgi:hypothetical protein
VCVFVSGCVCFFSSSSISSPILAHANCWVYAICS